ncbi:hypothetical protein [Kaarinaea lacus]
MLRYLLIISILFSVADIANAAIWYVSPAGGNSATDPGAKQTVTSIQAALNMAAPGDTIMLQPGEYFEDFHSVRDGNSDQPITIKGTLASVIRGSGKRSHIVDINHDYHHLIGFTVDGLSGDPTVKHNYRNKLIYVHGRLPHRGVKGTLIDSMNLRNAGGECLRLRYFISHSEIRNNRISHCGVYDFKFPGSKKNGEAIYLGTSSTQWANGINPTDDPDHSTDNWIHNNEIQTWGDECVDIKEGAEHNIVEHNVCEHQLDSKSAGFDARGDHNIFRYNIVRNNTGSAFRLGGHKVNGRQYGIGNQVYGNDIGLNAAGAIKIVVNPQGQICDNRIQLSHVPVVRGKNIHNIHPASSCSQAADLR